MAKKTRLAYFEIASKLLQEKGVEESRINELLENKKNNSEKMKALQSLCDEHEIQVGKKQNNNDNDLSPTLQEYFGKKISDLLIRRKQLINKSIEKNIDINKITSTPYNNLSDVERKSLQKYIQYKDFQSELDDINVKLEEKGIKISITKNTKTEQE